MSPEVALFCRANRAERCPVSGVKQPCRRNPETAEFDPEPTFERANGILRLSALRTSNRIQAARGSPA
jgi:hypothetical protein